VARGGWATLPGAGRSGKGAASCSIDGATASEAIDPDEIRFWRALERFYRLGPRALAELLAEIGARFLIWKPIEAAVARYVARLDPDVLQAIGGDQLPLLPASRLIVVNLGRVL
jgi:hypothetical protein